jgi:hypothetical protein
MLYTWGVMRKVNHSKRQKVGAMLDSEVLMAAKMVAAKEHKRLSQIIEEALVEYLKRKGTTSVVLQTHGTLKIDPKLLQQILEEEPGVLEV